MSDAVLEALADVCSAWQALVPPNKVSVSEGAASILRIKRPGGGSGPWNPAATAYMREPVDMLGSRHRNAVVFVGPAQSGKTVGLGEGWLAHAVVNDPGDMLAVQMTEAKAREYSKQRIDRAIKNSPKLAEMIRGLSQSDNTHDKLFRNGMWLRIAWPTATNMASTSYRYVFGTDYDRWPDDIDGEGAGFGMLLSRIKTFLSRGMVCIESSPGRPMKDPNWRPASAHEAPPVEGILSIYNMSDRRRWYWQCPHCAEWFQCEPGLGLFKLPSFEELVEEVRYLDIDRFARQHARVVCPHSGCIIAAAEREAMNLGGRWLPDGVVLDASGRMSGEARTSSIAGYWLGGAAATYLSWEDLVRNYVQAVLDYTLTGDEKKLQTTTNVDQCMPYASRHIVEASRGEDKQRFDADLERYVVPDEARFLVAFVDVQGGRNARFEVEVHAVGEHKEQWLVDRYAITKSKREGIGEDFAPLDPAAYALDWDLITEKIVNATYRTRDPNREMRLKLVVVDSGGEDGVTDKAYEWYRRVRKQGLHRRVRLTKGASGKVEWYTRESMVGSRQGEGDIPLLQFCPNKFKDMVAAGRRRATPGPGYYHWPVPKGPRNPDGWMPQSVLDELDAEVRNEAGVWEQIKRRNETLDSCVGVLVGCADLGLDKRGFWDNPPSWALPHDRNSEIVSPEERRALKAPQAAAAVAQRRVARSNYLG